MSWQNQLMTATIIIRHGSLADLLGVGQIRNTEFTHVAIKHKKHYIFINMFIINKVI